MDVWEKIKKIEEEIRTTPYHKGTEHHIGQLRAKLARLREQLLISKQGGKGAGFTVKKEGEATVGLIGFPSVGKSTLLNKLTGAKSKTGDYEFTTLRVIPGTLELNGAKIQILDLPGIISQAASGRGRGKQILSAARIADLLVVLLEPAKMEQKEIIINELYQAGVRINQRPARIVIKKKAKGGIQVVSPPLSRLSKEQIVSVAQEFGFKNAEIIIKEDLSFDRLIDAFSSNRVYLPAIFVINKIDLIKNPKKLEKRFPDYVLISAQKGIGLEKLKKVIWQKLELIRVFLKPKRGEPDWEKPLILKKGATVLEAAQKISHDLAAQLKSARIWGASVKFAGQQVGLDHRLADGDLLYLMKK